MARSILITGASTGIGEASARALAARGWRVGLMARSAEKVTALAGELGDGALALPGDVTDPHDVAGAVAACTEAWGGLDAAFANAGLGSSAAGIEGGEPENWRRMVDVNIWGVLMVARAAMPALRARRGRLLLTGSAAGRRHLKGSVYGATKWFVHGLAGNVDEEMREWGGGCTVIAPGMVDTPFFDERKPDALRPGDVADAVVHALEAPAHATVREVYLMPNPEQL